MSSRRFIIYRIMYKYLSRVYRLLFSILQPPSQFHSSLFLLYASNAEVYAVSKMQHPFTILYVGIWIHMHPFSSETHLFLSSSTFLACHLPQSCSVLWCNYKITYTKLSFTYVGTVTHSLSPSFLLWNTLFLDNLFCYPHITTTFWCVSFLQLYNQNKLDLSYKSLFS